MKKSFPLLWLIVLSATALAQSPRLRAPLTRADSAYLDAELRSCAVVEPTVGFSYRTDDLYAPGKKKGLSPCSLDDVRKLEKQLKGGTADIGTYHQMGQLYNRLNRPVDAEYYFKKALDLDKELLSTHPDSVDALVMLGTIYSSMNRYEEAIPPVQHAVKLRPLDTSNQVIYAMLFVFSGQYTRAKEILNEQINKYGNRFGSYYMLPLADMYSTLTELNGPMDPATKRDRVNNQPLVQMPPLRKFYESDSTSMPTYLFYHVVQHLNLEMRILMNSMLDNVSASDFKFSLLGRDSLELLRSEQVFAASLKRKDITNKYYPNKVLGNVYMILGQYRKAEPYLKKAIEGKPLAHSDLMSNPAEDYDNLIANYYMLKDTAAAEKLILDKLRIKPSIDPNAKDQKDAGLVYLRRRDYANAGKYLRAAEEMGNKDMNLYTGLALLNYFEHGGGDTEPILRKVFAMSNEYAPVYSVMGLIALKKGDAATAQFLLQKASELGDSSAKAITEKYIATE